MKEYKHIIKAENGLHARPAGALASCAKTFKSSITVSALGKNADAKRLLSLMSLGATRGTELHFVITGEDEQSAYEAIVDFCERLGDMR
ncbi:MAG: HPr family phosphocarrier protein [Clostridia bacterium]|nr:HPr family phosphocarrier protein [Clostridia bacterium]